LADIFVSYSRQDKARVAPLVAALEAEGWSIWWDPAITPGEEFDSLISKELDAARTLLVVWSAASVDSRWVRGEARDAADRGVLVPVRFDNARLPIDFRAVHTTDLDAWGEDPQNPAFRSLCQALEAKLGARKKKAVATAIAVLPLANMSADPENEYFSDGMTEEIINALSKVPGIHVASRSSSFAFKGRKDVDAREIGEKLGVTTLLEGSVRKVGSRIRIAAQLVNVENGYQLWSETYDRQLEDIFAIQDEISRSIVEALKLRLVGDEAAVVAPTKSLDAYTTYLKGRFHFNKFTELGLRKALDLFQSALLQDPGFARAYAGIADVWCDLADDWVAPDDAYPRAKAAAERALQRDPELADAMISIGKVLCWHEWKFAEGVRQAERAVTLSPNNAEAHWLLGTALPLVGRLREGYQSVRRALELDPLRVEYFGWATRLLLYAKDYEAALKQGDETFEIDEKYGRGFIFVGSTHLAMGDAETALEWFQRGQSLDTAVRSYDAMIVRALAALGRREEAEEILARLETESRQQYVRAEYLAMGHAAVGHLDQAFGALERAYQARSGGLIYLHLDPGYEPLRVDPRYAELVQRIGLR
jgi:adenylate cyclase